MRRSSPAVLAATIAIVALPGTPAFAETAPPGPTKADCSWTHRTNSDYTKYGCDQDPGYWYQHGGSGNGGGGGGHH